MVDLEAAGGIVSLVGDTDVAEEVAAAIAVQAATTAWSGAVQVIASGLPNGLEQIGDDRIRVTDDLRAELPELGEDRRAARGGPEWPTASSRPAAVLSRRVRP